MRYIYIVIAILMFSGCVTTTKPPMVEYVIKAKRVDRASDGICFDKSIKRIV
jgi:PBP1b-binding outer membrane lipoprotein LpoB